MKPGWIERILQTCFKFENKGSRAWGDYVKRHLEGGYNDFARHVAVRFYSSKEYQALLTKDERASSWRVTDYLTECKKRFPKFDWDGALQKQWEIHKLQIEEIQRQRTKNSTARAKVQFKKQEYGVQHYSDLLQVLVSKLFPSMEIKGYATSKSALEQARQDFETAVECWRHVHGESPWRILLDHLSNWDNPVCTILCISRCDREDLIYVLTLGGKCSELAKLRLETEGDLK